jgi:AraC-like DNA-binding protein
MEKRSIDLSIKSPIESIDGIWKFTRDPHKMSKCNSLPGHLLHLVEKGSYRLRANQREYQITEGDLIYYHGSEQVEWEGDENEVIFYSVGFTAPALQALPLECRVFQASDEPKEIFKNLYEASLMPASTEKAFILFSQLTKLLALIEKLRAQFQYSDDSENDWWQVEKYFYSLQHFRPSIDELCEHAVCSRSTIVRLCRKATGSTPLSRLQEIRMAEAKALLKNSTLNVTQVSEYLGYPRIHEFSREFSQYFGNSPTAMENITSS